MYEKFTDRARRAMQLANMEAQQLQHDYIGTEHILLGLIDEGSGIAVNVLRNLNVDLHKIRKDVECLITKGPGAANMQKLPQTPRTKTVLACSMEEARNLGHNYVGTEHILLGLLREREGVAAQILMNSGLDLEKVHTEISAILQHSEFLDRNKTFPQNQKHDVSQTRIPFMFVRFNKSGQRVMHLAKEEAVRINHEYIGTEHILLGLIKEVHNNKCPVVGILKDFNVNLHELRLNIEKLVQPGLGKVTIHNFPQTPRAKKAIEYASEEARNLGQNLVGVEHILLGLLREPEGVAAVLLMNEGLKLEELRDKISSLAQQPDNLLDQQNKYLADQHSENEEMTEHPSILATFRWMVPALIVALIASLAANIILLWIMYAR